MSVLIQPTSIETVESEITAPDNDPTTEPVWWSFTQGTDEPTVWTPGTWEMVLPAPTLTAEGWVAYTVSPTIGGPGATVVLTLGTWNAWVKIGDGLPPDVPVKPAGTVVVAQSVALVGPCAVWDSAPGCCELPAGLDGDTLASIEAAATEFLWAKSGRRYGICTHTVRPCRERCVAEEFAAYRWPSYYDSSWSWLPMPCLCQSDPCSCVPMSQIRLRGRVQAVDEVIVDGVILDPSAYRLDEYRLLVRLDGETWPACQDHNLASSEEGTWEVTWRSGNAVPELGKRAQAAVVCQTAKWCQDPSCAPQPGNIVQKVRQGVTIRFDGGAIGALLALPDVAEFLEFANPNKLQRRSRIYRADALPLGRRVGTGA